MAKLQAGSSSITDGDRENPPQLPTLPLLQHQIFPSLILVVINTQRNAKLEERLTFWHSIWAYSTISLVPSGQRFGYAGFRQRRARRSWDPITTFHQEGNTNPSIFFFPARSLKVKYKHESELSCLVLWWKKTEQLRGVGVMFLASLVAVQPPAEQQDLPSHPCPREPHFWTLGKG